jgi:beta-glucosidase
MAETPSVKNNPAGRLPVTFYTGIDQMPAFDDYSTANRTYRYFKGKPLFAFGDGLSYSTFTYSQFRLSTEKMHAGETLMVNADLKNNGPLAGDEVVELNLRPLQTAISPKSLSRGLNVSISIRAKPVPLHSGSTRALWRRWMKRAFAL